MKFNIYSNCQFPKKDGIRRDGRIYKVPRSDVSIARGPMGKYFYRIGRKNISIVEESNVKHSLPNQIFKSEECVICLEEESDIIFLDCGHMCVCSTCNKSLRKDTCVMCRKHIKGRINKSEMD